MGWVPVTGTEIAAEVVGLHSSSPDLSLNTTNRAWWGVFIAAKKEPSSERQGWRRSCRRRPP